MNWDAIGAVAELLGALAVIASLIYLAQQIRHTWRNLENQAENDVYLRTFQAYDPVYQENNGEIMWKGLHYPDQLSESEAFVFDLLMDRQMTVLIQTARQVELGMLNAEVMGHFAAHYQRIYMDSPGGRAWVEKYRHVVGHSLDVLGLK